MTDTVTIKLKPYLREFICGFLNDDYIKASSRNFIGKLLKPFIAYSPENYKPVLKKNNDFIIIELKWFHGLDLRGNVYVSERNQREFESLLDSFFKQLFYQYIDDKIRYFGELQDRKSSKFKRCIIDFCEFYNIGYNHVNYEMLKKSYYRYRQKSGLKIEKKRQKTNKNYITENQVFKKIKSAQLSLSCPLIFLL